MAVQWLACEVRRLRRDVDLLRRDCRAVEVRDKQRLKLVELIKATDLRFREDVDAELLKHDREEEGGEVYYATGLSGGVADQGSEIGLGEERSEQEGDLLSQWYNDDSAEFIGAGASEIGSDDDKSDGGKVDGDEGIDAFYLWYDGGADFSGSDMSNVEGEDKSDEGEENEECGLLQTFVEEEMIREASFSDVDVGEYKSEDNEEGGFLQKFVEEQENSDGAGSSDVGVECVEEELIDGVGSSDVAVGEYNSEEDEEGGFLTEFVEEEKNSNGEGSSDVGEGEEDKSDDEFLHNFVEEEMGLYGHQELDMFRKFNFLDDMSVIQISQVCMRTYQMMTFDRY